jgi:hypothetical protein
MTSQPDFIVDEHCSSQSCASSDNIPSVNAGDDEAYGYEKESESKSLCESDAARGDGAPWPIDHILLGSLILIGDIAL